MFGCVFIAALIAIGALALLIARQPERFSVERSTSVAAPLDQVFAQVNDLHNWEQWSPWAKRDLNISTKGRPSKKMGHEKRLCTSCM